MAQNVVVSCPHCGSTGTFTIGISPGSKGSGSSPAQCRQCHKTFRIEFRQGKIYRVTK